MLKKKQSVMDYLIWKLSTEKRVVKQGPKNPGFRILMDVNMLKGLKQCWYLHGSSFVICFDHSEKTSIQRILS